MQTSPSTSSRRVLAGSMVSGQEDSVRNDNQSNSENNKENLNGSTFSTSTGTDQSCKSSLKLDEMTAHRATNETVARTKHNPKQAKGLRKVHMTCSELFNVADPKSTNNLSPTSTTSELSSCRGGRKGSDMMKYSSLTDKSYSRVPSANTISRMLPSSASSSEQSPQTQQILKEVEDAYLSSPIPSSYRKQNSSTGIYCQVSDDVERAYMSSPISPDNRGAASEKKKQPAVSHSHEPKPSSRSSSAEGSSTRSPVTVSSGVSCLAVKREKQQRKQRMIDAESKKGVNGRQNLDKRTARLRYGESFKADILQYRNSNPHLNNGSNHANKTGSQIQERALNGISVALRKRPIFDYELDRGDYDVVSIDNNTENSQDTCIIHNCVMHPDMKQMQMKITQFPITAAFDEHCSDDDVYRCIAEPLVRHAANGGISTILMYGQTGCGKSHTMSGIETRTARGLFEILGGSNSSITLQFVELCGNKEINDLLSTSSPDAVKVRDLDDGSAKLVNATSLDVSTVSELMNAMQLAKSRRATEATDKNGVSSRSHAICQIKLKGQGVLTLIDCAGSERRHDSMYHSSQRQAESAFINASLWALKECVRARANKSSRVPYRSNNLTRILRESLERDDAKLCVVGCVAPNASDTEHTMETLKTISTIVGIEDKIIEEKARVVTQSETRRCDVVKIPKEWSHKDLKAFLAKKKIDYVKLPPNLTGAALMKMSASQMKVHLCLDSKDKAESLFKVRSSLFHR
eukprot:scaffold3030_cov72-Cyclotella_meneghiniana.AAC.5